MLARCLLAALALCFLCFHTPARAQAVVYSPYGASSQTSQDGSLSPAGQTGQFQAGGNATGSGGAYGQGGGPSQFGAPNGEIGPTFIPNSAPALAADEKPATRLTGAPTPGANPEPLYVRPGSQPGQFELFRRPPPQAGEFETFVKKTLGRPLRRFGSSLILNGGRDFTTPPTATVPPDYLLNPGDELIVGITGSVEAELRLTIDSEGRVFIPRIGAIEVAGIRYGDLAAALSRRFSQQYKQAKLSVVIGRLHGLTVYVTGYAVSPGAYTVGSLSTMVDAVLAAGGPSAGGSFRSIQLRRNGQTITDLDLYDLLLKGDKTHDAVLQNEDVLNIGPVGPETAVTGSVNAEAIYEAKKGETLADVIGFAGGLNSLADDTRLLVVRLGDADAAGSRQLTFAQAHAFPAERGDIVRILSLGDIARPQERQAILATVEGEVDHPGRYYLPPGSTVADLLSQAGGLTAGAYVFGTDFDRESVRRQQQMSFDRAIDDLELSAAASPLASLGGGADRVASGQARLQASLAVIDKLKERKPDGRLVLNLPYDANALPTGLGLEDNDHIYVPPRPKTVGVFGAVYQPGSFLFGSAVRIADYLKLAGGPRKIADRGEIFVVRANGAVISVQQNHGLGRQPALPGDVIFVPVRTSPSAFDKLRDIATVVYQLGIGAATLGLLATQL